MIKVRIRSNSAGYEVNATPDRTPRSILEEVGVDYSSGVPLLDGVPLQIGQMDKSLADLGIQAECRLVCAVKADCN